jgi:hypothetical protein
MPKSTAWLDANASPSEPDGTYWVPLALRDELDAVWNAEVEEQFDAYFKSPANPWLHVETFEDLRILMLRYILGREPMTPHSAGPLDEESKQILDKLIRINELGAISFSSQPGRLDQWGRQRAYLQILVDDSVVPALRDMAEGNGLVWASNPHQALEPEYGQFVVTENAEGEGYTFAPIGIAYPLGPVYPTIRAIQEIAAARTSVSVADTDWNTNRLFDLVIEVLERAQRSAEG